MFVGWLVDWLIGWWVHSGSAPKAFGSAVFDFVSSVFLLFWWPLTSVRPVADCRLFVFLFCFVDLFVKRLCRLFAVASSFFLSTAIYTKKTVFFVFLFNFKNWFLFVLVRNLVFN